MRPRIIVIEDDKHCRELLSLMLESNGYEVISLPEPSACPLYMTQECSCSSDNACGDFLITDNRMPRMTGLEFVEHQSRRGCKGIIGNKLVISGTWTASELKTAERLGCEVMYKPYKFKALLEWLDVRKKLISPWRKLNNSAALS